jgi:hypothetical protein
MTSPTERSPATPTQLSILAAMGALYWFLAALIVRWTAPIWAGLDGRTALTFALIVIGTLPALLLGLRVAGLGRNRSQVAALVMTGAALLLDGLALTWGRSLYGSDPATVLSGAASIMWGAGVALAFGWFLEQRAR